MIRFSLVGLFAIVALIDASCMVALNAALSPPGPPRARLLFVGCDSSEYCQRMVAGARDAAREYGVDLEIAESSNAERDCQFADCATRVEPREYDGVAILPGLSESQSALIAGLRTQTKLVTVDHEACKSKRLCHISYRPISAGGLAARLALEHVSRPGKVALVGSTSANDGANKIVRERQAGFEETWEHLDPDGATRCPVVQVTADSDLAGTLADPEVTMVVALDSNAADAVLKALARYESQHVSVIAFDPSEAVFDAIEDGRVCSAIYSDPYRSGFTAIQRLRDYCGDGRDYLPMPGIGNDFLVCEVVRKSNVANVRARLRS